MDKRKKILVATFSDISDHQDKAVVLYEELIGLGQDAYLLLPEKIDVECGTGERIRRVRCPDRPGIAKGTFNIKNLCHVLSIIKKEKFDVIFFETLHVWNLPVMMLSGKKTQVYQMIHDVIPHGGDKGVRQVILMNKTVCRMADKIIICNQKYKDSLCQKYRVSLRKVKCIELWERFPDYRQPVRTGHMLFFGRLNPYKGADKLLEIVKQCKNIEFDVVGKVDPQVTDIITELKGFSNVRISEGYISDSEIEEVFEKAEWVILPYNSATQSGVVVEAYKNSKPVISFDVGAISEQIQDGKTGYLIGKGNTEAFSSKLKQVADYNDIQYASFCREAYLYGYNQFSAKKAAEKMIKILME